jgi:aurora kinase
MEYANGDNLFNSSSHDICENRIKKIFKQVILAIKDCHDAGYIHRDIGLENFVWVGETLKLIDFGSSTNSVGEKSEKLPGNLYYSAPELINHLDHNYKVDLWSLGVLLFELLTNRNPFDDKYLSKIKEHIKECKYTFPKFVSKGGKELINSILKTDPEERPSLNDIIDNSWLNQLE